MKRNKYIRLLWGCCNIFIMIMLGGCGDDFTGDKQTNGQRVSIGLNLNTPGLDPVMTKAMDNGQESAIDPSKIQILIFQQVGTEELFRYQATITNRRLPQITIEVESGATDDKFRLVVLANVGQQTIAQGTKKAEALDQFLFDCTGKWNATSSAPAKIPMWGELDALIPLTHDRSERILLYWALAKVDVALRMEFNTPESINPGTVGSDVDGETVLGLDYFKINEIRVYRTLNQAYVASSPPNILDNEVVMPHIPPTAKWNDGACSSLAEADKNPLLYTLTPAADSYLSEIYIPESVIIDGQSNMDNVPCLVIGGCYGENNTTNITYYRADFAVYKDGIVKDYKPVLRNHRYIFDIKSVASPGFSTPEQALQSFSAPMQLEVLDWTDLPFHNKIRGNYYIQVEEREIWMDAMAQPGSQANTFEVAYQTDLELDGTIGKSFSYTWKSVELGLDNHFHLDIDYTNKIFIFTAKSDNTGTGSSPRSDIITLCIEDICFDITVNQRALNVEYDILCESVVVKGKYREGVPLNYTDCIELTIKANSSLEGKEYEVKTIEKNGIYFKATGIFNGSGQIVGGYNHYMLRLEGFGTPVNESGEDVLRTFEVDIVSNSQNTSACKAKIIMAYRTKKILAIGANAIYEYGYMLEDNSASRAFVDAGVNFGIMPNSTVPMEENEYGNAFTIEVMTHGKGMVGEVIQYDYLQNMLNTFKPDIILTGQAIYYFTLESNPTNVIDLLADFVEKGGVFIMCNEYYPHATSTNAMVGKIMGLDANGDSRHITSLLFKMNEAVDDPITNGPFGDMRGKNWGADGTIMFGFSGLPENQIVIYSTRTDGAVCMFRHKHKPFFYVGEGGFISNPNRYIGGTYMGSNLFYPFAIDAEHKPIPRTNYAPGNGEVFNSKIFGNILSWAVDCSDSSTF